MEGCKQICGAYIHKYESNYQILASSDEYIFNLIFLL